MTAGDPVSALRESSPRRSYTELPNSVRAWVDRSLRSPVVTAHTQRGGFSPGVAARVKCADGSRAFVKAVGAELNPSTPDLFRAELRALQALPELPLRPRLLDAYDDGAWVALLLEEVPGRLPALPWQRSDLDRVFEVLAEVAELSPASWPAAPSATETMRRMFTSWETIATEGTPIDAWCARHLDRLVDLERAALAAMTAHESICHIDTRSDNILLTGDRAVLVDWAMASVGPSWLDPALLLLEVRAAGRVDPEALIRAHPVLRDVDPGLLTAVWAGIAGMFVRSSGLPPPPGLPTLRTFQAAYAESTLAWTRARTGLG